MDVMDEGDFSKFEFKLSFGRISYIAQPQGRMGTVEQLDINKLRGLLTHWGGG